MVQADNPNQPSGLHEISNSQSGMENLYFFVTRVENVIQKIWSGPSKLVINDFIYFVVPDVQLLLIQITYWDN
jgi:hypothetical protein